MLMEAYLRTDARECGGYHAEVKLSEREDP
jgi:hypothetical protein